jgi:hypothetical protein
MGGVVLLAPARTTVPSPTDVIYGLGEVVVAFMVALGVLVLVLGIIREIGR